MLAFDNENVLGRCSSMIREDFGVFIIVVVGFVFVDMKLFSMKEVILALRVGVWGRREENSRMNPLRL